jgi:hypothetical protein
MTTIADNITRVRVILDDQNSIRYTDTEITEAIRQILSEYSKAYPNYTSDTVTFAAVGREIDLVDGSSNPLPIEDIVRVYFPYDATDTDPDPHEAFYFYNVEGTPTLHIQGDYIPQTDDVVKFFYSTPHTMDGLDSQSADTYPADHTNLVVLGASAVSAMHRAAGLSESVGSRSSDTNQLEHWAKQQYSLYTTLLEAIRSKSSRQAVNDNLSAWTLDNWDMKRSTF